MEFEFKFKVNGRRKLAIASVETKMKMIDENSLKALELRAARKHIIFAEHHGWVSGLDIKALEYRCRPVTEIYVNKDKPYRWFSTIVKGGWTAWAKIPKVVTESVIID